MSDKVQIVFHPKPSSASPGSSSPGPFSGVKAILAGILFAAVAVGILIVVLVLGSIIAAAVWILVVITIAVLILKSAMRHVRK